MRLRLTAIMLLVATAFVSVRAEEPADSLSRALATFWGAAFRTDDFGKSGREAFRESLSLVLASDSADAAAYVRGAVTGQNVLSAFSQMERLGMKADRKVLAESLLKVVDGKSVGFTPVSAQAYIDSRIDSAETAAFSPESQREFLASAASRPGSVTTPSGLVFEVVTEGEGSMPVSGDKVLITYRGSLSDGSVFDETEGPLEFDVDRFVPGFTEGLKMMKPGGVYRLVIPPSLAYGDRGIPGVIPAGAVLDFTVGLEAIR